MANSGFVDFNTSFNGRRTSIQFNVNRRQTVPSSKGANQLNFEEVKEDEIDDDTQINVRASLDSLNDRQSYPGEGETNVPADQAIKVKRGKSNIYN